MKMMNDPLSLKIRNPLTEAFFALGLISAVAFPSGSAHA
jgi:hypothetical protein